MHLLVPFQHLHKLSNLFRACLGFLGGLNSEQNGVAISTIKRSKEILGSRTAIQCGLEVTWHSCFAGRVIRGLPASVTFGALNFLKSGRFHFSCFNQGKRLVLVDLGPYAFTRASSEFLEPELFAMGPLLSVYPSEAKRDLNGFIV